MHFLNLVFLLFNLLVSLLFSLDVAAKDLIFSRHQAIFINVSLGANIHLENKDIVKLKDLGHKIKISARKIGTTQLSIDKKIYQIHVIGKRAFSSYKLLLPIAQSFSEISLKVLKGSPHLLGELANIEVLKKLTSLPPIIKKHFSFSLNVPIELQAGFTKFFSEIFIQSQLPPLNFSFSPNTIALLPKEYEKIKNSYKDILDHFGINLKTSPLVKPKTPMIKIKVILAEIKKGYRQRFGLRPPSSIHFSLFPKFDWLSNNEESLLQIEALESSGSGKVLASPTLISKSGELSSFSSGGEIPFRVGTLGRGQIVWKSHGISLKILPTLDFLGRLSLKIDSEISSVDLSNSIDGLPGFNVNKLSSFVELDSPRPLILSGLVRNETLKDRQGFPLLSRLPIIGALFSSRRFLNNKSEFFIILLPEVINDRLRSNKKRTKTTTGQSPKNTKSNL